LVAEPRYATPLTPKTPIEHESEPVTTHFLKM